MAIETRYSLVLSLLLFVLTFAAMQTFRDELATEGKMTILGGFIGSWLFVLLLTAVGNLESYLWGKDYQARLPEVIVCMAMACVCSGFVHRVCVTTCFLFSLVALFFVNRISFSTYSYSAAPTGPTPQPHSGGRGSHYRGKARH